VQNYQIVGAVYDRPSLNDHNQILGVTIKTGGHRPPLQVDICDIVGFTIARKEKIR